MKKLPQISLKSHPNYNEEWVKNEIANDTSILGLGEIILKDKERVQSGAGIVDFLFEDPDTRKRYECEVQLGKTNESHIIRTIEYWDIERKRYPQLEHTAILIAEDVTSRFLNVIHLFNGHIPLILIKMTAYQVGDDIALTFTKILDEVSLGFPEDDEYSEPTNREYWEKKSSKKMLSFTDELLELVKKVEPDASLKYNKYYIGLEKNGIAQNFCSFKPRKNHVLMFFKGEIAEDLKKNVEDSIEELIYDSKWRQSQLKLTNKLTDEQKAIVEKLIQSGYNYYN